MFYAGSYMGEGRLGKNLTKQYKIAKSVQNCIREDERNPDFFAKLLSKGYFKFICNFMKLKICPLTYHLF